MLWLLALAACCAAHDDAVMAVNGKNLVISVPGNGSVLVNGVDVLAALSGLFAFAIVVIESISFFVRVITISEHLFCYIG